MSAARVIRPEDVPALNITITSSGVASPNQAVIISSGQGVVFTNSSGSTVSIVFETDAEDPSVVLFSNVNGLSPTAPNNTNSQTPNSQYPNRTVNYYITGIGPQPLGPYAIQVGAGPMYVSVTYDTPLNEGDCTPGTVAIPLRGTIEMISTDYHYKINWNASNGNPFPGLADIYTLSNPLTRAYTNSLPIGPYGYTVQKVGMITDNTGHGGGTVRVGG
jgi:hypothetical protein